MVLKSYRSLNNELNVIDVPELVLFLLARRAILKGGIMGARGPVLFLPFGSPIVQGGHLY